jgi:hypothetical protein
MDPLDNLEKRIAEFSNHYQKYLYIIRRYKDSLTEALSASGNLMHINLWRTSFSPEEDMCLIISLSDDTDVRVKHLSCYYAIQSLYMNLRNLDILELGIASAGTLPQVYHHFMMQIGSDFRDLTRLYILNLLNIYLPKEKQPEFFVCSVGTRSDQDDIDIGIITADDTYASELNHAFQLITQDMLVYATPLHLYLSEHVGSKHLYTTTIAEYQHMLTRQIQDVVIISELLNARIILGNHDLFKKFQKKIISIYFYHPKNDVRFHEGFLRGILGEVRAWLIKPVENSILAPKEDALRMLKSILHAKKTIYRLTEVNAWDIITVLMEKENKSNSLYKFLFEATSFLEMFKFLLQMYIVQEETFRPDDINEEQRKFIAEKMGYHPIGMISAWEQVITDYYFYVKEVRKHCERLIVEISSHLHKVSLFRRMLTKTKIECLPKGFIYTAYFYRGTKYWDDLLNLLEKNDALLNRFIREFEALPGKEQQRLVVRYIEWVKHSTITLLRFLTIIGHKQQYLLGDTLYIKMLREFVKYAKKLPNITLRLSRVYYHYPMIIHEFYKILPHEYYPLIESLLVQPVVDESTSPYHEQLLHLTQIHAQSSQYFKRIFFRCIIKNDIYLKSLLDLDQIAKIAAGLMAQVDFEHDFQRKKDLLGQYYDSEFLRIGIGTLYGQDLAATNRGFTHFCDQYMKKLFDICQEELPIKGERISIQMERFSLFSAGGHARKEAYDDDYDIIAIIDSDSAEDLDYVTHIVARMNREMVKRGLLPHYRLGEILGGFVTPVSTIVKYLENDEQDTFIDLSQLLGARMIIGRKTMNSIIKNKILKPFIFKNKKKYIRYMIKEIKDRQSKQNFHIRDRCNLKETRGGLRDIEAVTLVLKAYLEKTTHNTTSFFQKARITLPALKSEFDVLIKAISFLRTVRDLYRISEAAEDRIRQEYLARLALLLYQNKIILKPGPGKLMKEIQTALHDSARACDGVINYVKHAI